VDVCDALDIQLESVDIFNVPVTVYLPNAVNDTSFFLPCVPVIRAGPFAIAPFKNPCGVSQMFRDPDSVRPSVFWFWIMSPGIGRMPPWPVAGLNGPAPPPRGGYSLSIRMTLDA